MIDFGIDLRPHYGGGDYGGGYGNRNSSAYGDGCGQGRAYESAGHQDGTNNGKHYRGDINNYGFGGGSGSGSGWTNGDSP